MVGEPAAGVAGVDEPNADEPAEGVEGVAGPGLGSRETMDVLAGGHTGGVPANSFTGVVLTVRAGGGTAPTVCPATIVSFCSGGAPVLVVLAKVGGDWIVMIVVVRTTHTAADRTRRIPRFRRRLGSITACFPCMRGLRCGRRMRPGDGREWPPAPGRRIYMRVVRSAIVPA
jgi:hypothetical protein